MLAGIMQTGLPNMATPFHARTGVGARVPSLDCPILRSGFPSVRTTLMKIQQKILMSSAPPEHEGLQRHLPFGNITS